MDSSGLKGSSVLNYSFSDYFDLDSFDFDSVKFSVESSLLFSSSSFTTAADEQSCVSTSLETEVDTNDLSSAAVVKLEDDNNIKGESTENLTAVKSVVLKRKRSKVVHRPLKAKTYKSLDTKLITFFSEYISLFNSADNEALTDLLLSTCDPDIQLVFDTPGMVINEVGIDCLSNRLMCILSSCPDGVRVDSNLLLREDKEGLFLSRDFSFTGTRVMKTDSDMEVLGDSNQDPGKHRNSETSASDLKIVQRLMDEEDSFPYARKAMRISIIGTYKFYVNMITAKTFRKYCSYSVWEIPMSTGESLTFAPLADRPGIGTAVTDKG